MAGDLTPRRMRWWPSVPEFFEDLPFELRLPASEHTIRVEEGTEDGAYVVRAELPGLDPAKDVEVTVEDGVLTVKAERTEEKKEKHRSEFRYGSFQRSVRLPAGAKEEDTTAGFENGVLTVRVPLGEVEKRPRRVEISTGT